jgi:hypothetical protein
MARPAVNAPGNLDDLPWTGITVLVAVLGLLLFMAVPMTGPSPEDRAIARKDRLCFVAIEQLRTAIEDYHGDHGTWPGQSTRSLQSLAPASFDEFSLIQQLQFYTDLSGSPLPTNEVTHPFGPYLPNGIPTNPLNGWDQIYLLVEGETFESVDADRSGWLYNPRNGDLQVSLSTSNNARSQGSHARN